jgi:hypothetical protein
MNSIFAGFGIYLAIMFLLYMVVRLERKNWVGHTSYRTRAGTVSNDDTPLEHTTFDPKDYEHILDIALRNFKTKQRRDEVLFGQAVGPSMKDCPVRLEDGDRFIADRGVKVENLTKGEAIVLERDDQPGQYKLRCFNYYEADKKIIHTTSTNSDGTKKNSEHAQSYYRARVIMNS